MGHFAFESLNYEIYENGNNLKDSQKEVLLNLHGGKEAWIKEVEDKWKI